MHHEALKIISEQARKQFPDDKIQSNTYAELFNSISRACKNGNSKELLLATEQELEHLERHDITNFTYGRMGIYAYGLAVLAIVASDNELVERLLGGNIERPLLLLMAFAIFIIISLQCGERRTDKRLAYLKFLLKCLNRKN